MQKRSKHKPTDGYFNISRHLAKCIMRAGAFNLHVDPVRMEISGLQQILISHVCDLEESESKGIIKDKNLLQVCSIHKSKS